MGEIVGASERDRTSDLLITNQATLQGSHPPISYLYGKYCAKFRRTAKPVRAKCVHSVSTFSALVEIWRDPARDTAANPQLGEDFYRTQKILRAHFWTHYVASLPSNNYQVNSLPS